VIAQAAEKRQAKERNEAAIERRKALLIDDSRPTILDRVKKDTNRLTAETSVQVRTLESTRDVLLICP
jgi:hypothetical protein